MDGVDVGFSIGIDADDSASIQYLVSSIHTCDEFRKHKRLKRPRWPVL